MPDLHMHHAVWSGVSQVRLAFLDGWRGFIIAQTAASYAVYKRMRYYEMQHNPASVDAAHRKLARHDLEH